MHVSAAHSKDVQSPSRARPGIDAAPDADAELVILVADALWPIVRAMPDAEDRPLSIGAVFPSMWRVAALLRAWDGQPGSQRRANGMPARGPPGG